jgi:aminobenzoyl-glutamate utilization protein B
MLREHVPSNARMHYIVSKGGAAPNIVPELAEIEIYARHPFQAELDSIWARILKCAQGAALATETTHEVGIISASSSILPNEPLARLMDKNLRQVGGVVYTPAERAFAEALAKTFPPGAAAQIGSESEVKPIRRPDPNAPNASTDAGDVSWVVPTIGLNTATSVPGTPGHSWQNAACAGSSIGRKGMVNPRRHKQRAGREYRSLIPEGKKPPLDYR